jgi:hypothetical protein
LFIVPIDGLISRPKPQGTRPPDGQHSLGGGWTQLAIQPAQFENPSDRLADGWVQEEQESLQHFGFHAEDFRRDDDRFT